MNADTPHTQASLDPDLELSRAEKPLRLGAHVVPAATSLLTALVWLGLSWWHPTVTYHLGSLIVALAWPAVLRARTGRPLGRVHGFVAAFAGLVSAAGAVAIAAATRALEGPTLIGRGTALEEALVLALVGSAWGWRMASRQRRSWFLPKKAAG